MRFGAWPVASAGLVLALACGRPGGSEVAVNIGRSGFRTCGGDCSAPNYGDPLALCAQTQSCLANNNCACRGFERARGAFTGPWDGWKRVWSPGDTVFVDTIANEYRCFCCKATP
jgi:hypothetical protein